MLWRAIATLPTNFKPLHLDSRISQILALGAGRPGDELLDDLQLAEWFGVSRQWPCQTRLRGTGPPCIWQGPRRVRYRRDQVTEWLLWRQAWLLWCQALRQGNGATAVKPNRFIRLAP
ncbi:unnamed protein product [uncultured bacterium]|nr:unnamed protein product [uncultured bacterium]